MSTNMVYGYNNLKLLVSFRELNCSMALVLWLLSRDEFFLYGAKIDGKVMYM